MKVKFLDDKVYILSSTLFTMENHEWENSMLSTGIKDTVVGICNSARIVFRPKKYTVAVMFENEDFEKYWFHVDTVQFYSWLKSIGIDIFDKGNGVPADVLEEVDRYKPKK